MNLIFKTLRYRNILSSGNVWTEINLDSKKPTLIIGDNGAGKSTILDALAFVLYGKPFREIRKPQLLNSINGRDLMVELEFESKGVAYKICRGMKPNVFEIFKEGTLINQESTVKDYQSLLEQNILRMNFKTFGQIVVLGSSTFIPFMQLKPGPRREVIEDLLDIEIFTTMNWLLKDKINKNRDEIKEDQYKIDLAKNKIDMTKQHTEELKEVHRKRVAEIKQLMKDGVKKVEDLRDEGNQLESEFMELMEWIQETNFRSRLSEASGQKMLAQDDVDDLKKEIAFYTDHENCPTCSQELEPGFTKRMITDKTERLKNCESSLKFWSEKVAEYEELVGNLEVKEKELENLKIQRHVNRSAQKQEMRAMIRLKGEMAEVQAKIDEPIDANLEELTEALRSLIKTYNTNKETSDVLRVAQSLLKDGGIKSKIIKQYVPIINQLVNKYLTDLDFFVQFELDEEFSETIRSRYRDDFSYSSFSEGEKARIDMALMLTWRAVARMRSASSCNLLILDEVFDGSLDHSGIDNLHSILAAVGDDSNIFVISHKGDQIADKFDRVLKFEKRKNFSVVTEQ